MKQFGFDHPCGWVVAYWHPDHKWHWPHVKRGKGWAVLVTRRLNIGFGWHWPPRRLV